MALNRQQKILLCVVGLGAAALTVDRVLIGYDVTGPAQATADSGVAIMNAATAISTPQVSAAAGTTPVASRNLIAERLAQVAAEQSFDIETLVDAFEPPSGWFAAPRTMAQEARPVATVEVERSFTDRYQLEAVVAGRDNGFAVINGRAVRPGEALDGEPGIVLLRVGERSAWFSVQGEQVELQLRTPGVSGNRLR